MRSVAFGVRADATGGGSTRRRFGAVRTRWGTRVYDAPHSKRSKIANIEEQRAERTRDRKGKTIITVNRSVCIGINERKVCIRRV